jgi:carbon-monoxide dehydrogenase iron sulfur subunit
LQSILPLLPAKERDIIESEEDDWMWRVHHAQCPDPDGRVIFKIERVGELKKEASVGSKKDAT